MRTFLLLTLPLALLSTPALASPLAVTAAECSADDVAVEVVEEGILEAKTTRMGTNLQLGLTGVACEPALEATPLLSTSRGSPSTGMMPSPLAMSRPR